MNIFENANTDNWQCPICKTNEDKRVALIKIYGSEEGGNIEAEQIHIDCIDLTVNKLIDKRRLLVQEYE